MGIKMKYTYRDECIISSKGDIGYIIFIIVLLINDLALFVYGFGFYLSKGSTIVLVGGLLASIITAAIVWSVVYSIRKQRKKALARRFKALKEGTRYAGKIVEAGMEMETEKYETRDQNNNLETSYRRRPNYWVNVEYTDPQSGETKRLHANHMVRDMKHLLGCSVDAYIWQEWSDFLQVYIQCSYIDTYHLQ